MDPVCPRGYFFRFLVGDRDTCPCRMPRGGLRLLRRSIQKTNANAAATPQTATTNAATIN